MKKTKLRLTTQTIRLLTETALADAKGGNAGPPDDPFPISLNCNGSWPCSAFTCRTLISCKC